MIESIKNVTLSISSIYHDLLNWELKGQNDTEAFQEKVKSLNSSLYLLDNLYAKLSKDEIITALSEFNDKKIQISELITDFNQSKMINLRIFLTLIKLKNRDNSVAITKYKSINEDLALYDEIEKDYYYTILKFVNDYIEDDCYFKVKDFLIKVKYYLSFIFQVVENDLITHNFKINPTLYWYSRLYGDTHRISSETLNSYRNLFALNNFDTIFKSFMNFNVTSANALQTNGPFLYSYLLLRANLLLWSDNDLQSVKEGTERMQKSGLFNDYKNLDIFSDLLNRVAKDREIPREVGLRLCL